MSDIIRQLNKAIKRSDTVFGDHSDLEDARDAMLDRDAKIARLRAGFMACLQDENECDAWLYGSACRDGEGCRCALELELWCNRAAHKGDI